jgi:hypothetical protein
MNMCTVVGGMFWFRVIGPNHTEATLRIFPGIGRLAEKEVFGFADGGGKLNGLTGNPFFDRFRVPHDRLL